MSDIDYTFYDRADKQIELANQQITNDVNHGQVSASMMYATSRFNAWVSASGWQSGEEMQAAKEETIEYFVEQYRMMLTENLNDYVDKFDEYMKPKPLKWD